MDKGKLEPSLLARKQKLNESRYLLQRLPFTSERHSMMLWCHLFGGLCILMIGISFRHWGKTSEKCLFQFLKMEKFFLDEI